MKCVNTLEGAKDAVVRFLTAKTVREVELMFPGGFYLKLKKHTRRGEPFLDVHTHGYDEGMKPLMEAAEWCAWELIGLQANGILA